MAITRYRFVLAICFLLIGSSLAVGQARAQTIGTNGIWMSSDEISRLPTSGDSWDRLVSYAQNSTNNPDLANQDDRTDANTVAKALVYARTGDTTYANEVVYTLQRLLELNPIDRSLQWTALGVLRALGAYAIAADLIDLKNYAPDFDKNQFRPWLDAARFAPTENGLGSVASLQERRPNNWGNHGSASRIAASLYLGDQKDLDRAVQVFRGYLGDRASYSGFKYGDDLSWQANPGAPVGINPKGSQLNGRSVDGVLPDDARRCGSFNPASLCKTNYMYEGLQGVVVAAEMLYRAGYPSYDWSDQAILRAFNWLYKTKFADGTNYPAEGDDRWMMYIINKRYGTNFPTSSTTTQGKMIGYTDWTHSPDYDTGAVPTPEPTAPAPDPNAPAPDPAPSLLNLVSAQFWSSSGNLKLTLEGAAPGATIWVTDDGGKIVNFGTAPGNGGQFSVKKQFYTQSGNCSYVVTDGSAQRAFDVSGSRKYGCASRR